MNKIWVMMFDYAPKEEALVRAIYDSEERAREGFKKCLRENWKELTGCEDEYDWDCHGDFNECVKDMYFNNFHCSLKIEVWELNEDWKGSLFDDL